MTPIEVHCPYCHRPPRERCRNSAGTPLGVDKTHQQRVKAAKLAGLSAIAGAGVCTCPGVARVHVQGVGGCRG